MDIKKTQFSATAEAPAAASKPTSQIPKAKWARPRHRALNVSDDTGRNFLGPNYDYDNREYS
jgi:hypothetical protein